ncbi:uncharacterized protein M437DRAFT_53014 [Aureobasidium melanogenum CBS 110374]|uniref:Uncharacterized protein n=1 Tax=Aureobasidium melanogenum (strain CBS 110374) TaxID=1043003 RepID=A0A074VK07_AURM1|nr:uncharacterized protein M437DRAFT_53014 [Aureobasidium melanogenum CBS 110374]KEQ60868.1 hypothetical protein M437DRAFT_53014 [Aureobasidium melanogenum CBS 110374]
MGKLHNRRRTRLRANKRTHHQALAMPPLSTPLMPVQSVFDDNMTFAYQQSAFCNSKYNSLPYHSSEQHGTRHTQYYGAEEGDESGDLCPLMLQVVLDLFDGVDYEDP